jgi:BirA family biotin operon repressor/biotin-[acetyl-CoA-carboxylase] ligase
VIPNPLITTVDEAESTNALAMARVFEGAGHGYAVRARRQTGGRGRVGRVWKDLQGPQLFLSIALVGEAYIQAAPLIPLVAGLSTAEALDECCGTRTGLKWPNDLLLDTSAGPQKVGGLLCEAAVRGGTKGVIVGIGVNLSGHEIPDVLTGLATTIERETGHAADPDAIAARVRHLVLGRCEALIGGDRSAIDAWRERDVTRGRRVIAADGLRGRADGIADDGALVIVDERGDRHEVRAGLVRWDTKDSAATPPR